VPLLLLLTVRLLLQRLRPLDLLQLGTAAESPRPLDLLLLSCWQSPVLQLVQGLLGLWVRLVAAGRLAVRCAAWQRPLLLL
jgi:hypothetical protein